MAKDRGWNIGILVVQPDIVAKDGSDSDTRLPDARRKARLAPGARVSGHHNRLIARPFGSWPVTQAKGPRTRAAGFEIAIERSENLINAVSPSAARVTVNRSRRASRRASQNPWTIAHEPSTSFASSGKALSQRLNAASTPNRRSALHSAGDGDHSMGKFDDSIDKGTQLRIFGPFEAHAPLPQLIVLTVEQA